MQISTIGIDLAKTVFQLHAVDADGATVIRKRLRRAEVLSFFAGLEPCLIGMEACATSHYWARELAKFGHTVKLMPPAYVKPYVKRGKNDATDAEAICEAVTRPNMRLFPVKSADQQAVLMLHRTRALLIRQQTMLANAFRAHLAEFGIVVAQGIRHVRALIERVFGDDAHALDLPALARIALRPFVAQLMELRLQMEHGSLDCRWSWTQPDQSFVSGTLIAARGSANQNKAAPGRFPSVSASLPRDCRACHLWHVFFHDGPVPINPTPTVDDNSAAAANKQRLDSDAIDVEHMQQRCFVVIHIGAKLTKGFQK